MSTCWKCEKVLPDGQVECDPPCSSPLNEPIGPRPEPFDPHRHSMLVFELRIVPDPAKVNDDRDFVRAVDRFIELLKESFSNSGLNDFCKPWEGPR